MTATMTTSTKQGKRKKKIDPPMCSPNCTRSHSVKDFAIRRGVSRKTVYEWLRKGMPREAHTNLIRCDKARLWTEAHIS